MQSNSDMNDKVSRLKVGLQKDKELGEYSVPKSELLPVPADDRFKRGLQAILSQGRGDCKWGATYAPAATSREEYVSKASDIQYFRSISAYCSQNGYNPNLFSFGNNGGIFNRGVCWWHSRFQRAGLYLGLCLPHENEESSDSARDKIRRLMRANEVVELPGFNSFFDFTKEYASEIQRCLERTQIIEGIFMFGWVNGLAGLSKVSPDTMKNLMDKIYREVSTEGIAYVKLQTPGIESHSWLITEMEQQGTDGYRYKFIDSNYFYNPVGFSYSYGDTHIDFLGNSMGVPYLQRVREFTRMKQAVTEYINSHST